MRVLATLVFAAVGLCACTPGTPRIDGVAGAPAGPSTPWTVPAPARTPPPPAAPPIADSATAALRKDSSTAGAVQALSLADAVDLALRNNPTTRNSWALARAAVDEYGSARGALFPSLNANVNLTSTSTSGSGAVVTSGGTVVADSTTTTTGGRAGGSASTTRTQLTPTASLSYLVFDLGGRSGTIEAAKQRAIEADLAHNATLADVTLQTESAVFSFLATRAMRDAQVVAVRESQEDTASAEARLRVGVGTLEEVLQTRTALAQAKLQLATLDGDVLTARGALAQALGLPANARFDIPNIQASDSVATIAATADTLINRAITQRPELAETRAEANALAAEVRVARSAGYPALTLSSNASFPQSLFGSTTGAGRTTSLVLGLQIPIFNGFSRQYDLRAARDQYQAGLARVAIQSQQITVQVFTSYAELQTSTQRVGAAVELLASAQQSAEVALGRYREGVGTIVDLLLARTALESARASEIQARWEWRTALAQLAHDVGSLDTSGRPNLPLRVP